jgi:hypothetical protein
MIDMIDMKTDSLPFSRIVLDIETAFCSEEALEIEKELVKAPGNYKDEEKKAAKIIEKQNGLKDGLLDSNPIACIGIEASDESGASSLWHFSTFSFSDEELEKLQEEGVNWVCAESEKDMLKDFRRWCDRNTDEATYTLTWNGYGFDLAKIRLAFARNAVSIPGLLSSRSENKHYDLMSEFGRKFTINSALTRFCSLETACKLMHVEFDAKQLMTGAEVPQSVKDGEYYKVAIYNLKDVLATSEVGFRMGF